MTAGSNIGPVMVRVYSLMIIKIMLFTFQTINQLNLKMLGCSDDDGIVKG